MKEIWIRYGSEGAIHLCTPSAALVAEVGAPRGREGQEARDAVVAALAAPLEYPPLGQTTVPGDRIVLAVDPHAPQVEALVAGVIETLLAGNARPEDIRVLSAPDARRRPVDYSFSLLPPELRERISIAVHDPRERSHLAYLAANEDAQPIYVSRAIVDADVVVPIGCLRREDSLGCVGVHEGLFPAFADQPTQERFQSVRSVDSPREHRRRCAEAEQAAWLLGVQFTVQAIPGRDGTLLHVLAGQTDAVTRRGRALCDAAWTAVLPRRARLVVACIPGGPEQQTWSNVARAIAAALRVVEDEGAIVLCTDLDVPPGPSLRRLRGAESLSRASRRIRNDHTADALAAGQLAAALGRVKVYLLSRLEEEVVEELGMAYVACSEEVARLGARHPSCIVLREAQYVVPRAADDGAPA